MYVEGCWTMKLKHESRFGQPDGIASSVTFVLENRELHASKEVLALCSPVFRRMFESDFRERRADAVPLPGKLYRDMVEFLLCLYPDTQKPLAEDNVFIVLSLADEYQVDILLRKCENYLFTKCKDADSTVSEITSIVLCAERFSMKDLFNASFDRLSKAHPDETRDIPEFAKLSEETRAKFVRLRSQALDIKLTDGNVHDVLKTAADYNERVLIEKCETHMVARCKKSEKPLIHGLVSMLAAADKHKLHKLKDEVLELAVRRKSNELEASPIFKMLSVDTRCKVLSKRLKIFEGLFTKLCKLRCHCCRKHSDYNCKICYISTTKECYEQAGLYF